MNFNKPYKITIYNSNISYTLNDNSLFSTTEFKVLNNQNNSCFIKCHKILVNGQIQLIYSSDKFIQLKSILPNIESGQCLSIISDIISNVISVKNNGFLSCQNLDISIDNIYIDPLTNQSKLIYLPLSSKLFPNTYRFETFFREVLSNIIHSTVKMPSQRIVELSKIILDDAYTLEQINSNFGGTNKADTQSYSKDLPKTSKLELTAINSPVPLSFKVDKDDFVIGRKESSVDGCVNFSKMVGRTHCKIKNINNEFYIIDLQSSNGTYVNKRRISPDRQFRIESGDTIRLANVEFKVSIN